MNDIIKDHDNKVSSIDLFNKQKELLDQFLHTGAIDKMQYDKSLNGLKEKMGIKD